MQKTTGWPKRLAIAGAIILAISIAALVSSYEDAITTMDPSANNIATLDGGDSEQLNLSKENSYLLFRLQNGAEDCTITEVETNTEVSIVEPGWLQTDREGADGDYYYVVGTFVPEGNGEHIVENTAEEGELLWVVDEMDVGNDMNSLLLVNGSCFGILCGSCLLPLALILWRNGRKNVGRAGLVMQTADGMLVPIAPADGGLQQRVPTTDEIWRSVHGGEILNLTVDEPQEPEVPAPFADRPDRVGSVSRVIDEVDSVEESVPEPANVESDEPKQSWKSWDEG
ncbi:MAG: hypothetical protein VYA86_03675 [Candidatus Thermoplasmatota archaeon]|nr:hypothetical protein [Candidatus Thermoplasmatota archaeon]MEE2759061.1 hypothetical protein [Candidatus Thermoplasmatota archaeon]